MVSTVGAIGLIGYLNLTVSGYTFYEYWHFIITRPVLYLFAGGLLLAVVSFIPVPQKKKKRINHRGVE